MYDFMQHAVGLNIVLLTNFQSHYIISAYVSITFIIVIYIIPWTDIKMKTLFDHHK